MFKSAIRYRNYKAKNRCNNYCSRWLTDESYLEEIPVPSPAAGAVLMRTSRSLISSGTERMLVEFGRAGWIEKVRQQPEKVQQVLDKMRTDGVLATLEAVRSKLDQPIPLGYCNVGRVVESGCRRAGIRGRRSRGFERQPCGIRRGRTQSVRAHSGVGRRR